jgi:hypothetical protein
MGEDLVFDPVFVVRGIRADGGLKDEGREIGELVDERVQIANVVSVWVEGVRNDPASPLRSYVIFFRFGFSCFSLCSNI